MYIKIFFGSGFITQFVSNVTNDYEHYTFVTRRTHKDKEPKSYKVRKNLLLLVSLDNTNEYLWKLFISNICSSWNAI